MQYSGSLAYINNASLNSQKQTWGNLDYLKGCPILLLEGQCTAGFSYNLLPHTCLVVSSDPEDLRVCFKQLPRSLDP